MKHFVHRCPCCAPTGGDAHHDYYACSLGVVVARFGNDPWAVHVGREVARSLAAAGDAGPLAEAYRAAVRVGYAP